MTSPKPSNKVRDNLGKFLIMLIVATGIFVYAKLGGDDTAPTVRFTPSDRTATASPAPPASLRDGHTGDQLDLNGTVILAGRIWSGETDILGDRTCAPIAFRNMTDDDVRVTQFDFKLITPAGLQLDATVGGATKMLPFGTTKPRGAAEGHVCFAQKFENRGTWTLVYQPSAWSDDKLTWTND